MRNLLYVLAVSLVLVLTGCSEHETSTEPTPEITYSIHDIPNDYQIFLDSLILEESEQPPIFDMEAYGFPDDNALSQYDVFSVTFLWGDLFGNSSSDVAMTDWSGTLTVDNDGLVRVRYTIDFEPGQDSILVVNTPDMAAWVSYTAQDFDGVNFLVYISRLSPDVVQPSITFETGPFILSLNYRQLFNYAAYYQIDNSKAVVVHSQVVWTNSCPGGTMQGEWIKETDQQGRFQGFWIDRSGEPIGYMVGNFWTNEDYSRQFSGSVSGIYADVVIAELQGIWEYDDYRLCPICGDDHGYFRGKFTYLMEDREGYLKGVFGDWSLPPDRDTLPFVGVWQTNCPYVTPSDADYVNE
jgi:hypothetical protein